MLRAWKEITERIWFLNVLEQTARLLQPKDFFRLLGGGTMEMPKMRGCSLYPVRQLTLRDTKVALLIILRLCSGCR